MTVLGVPMSKTLKDQIKAAADINRRTMADWARLELEEAAERVLAAHRPGITTHMDHDTGLKVADKGNGSSPSTPVSGASAKKVRYPKKKSS